MERIDLAPSCDLKWLLQTVNNKCNDSWENTSKRVLVLFYVKHNLKLNWLQTILFHPIDICHFKAYTKSSPIPYDYFSVDHWKRSVLNTQHKTYDFIWIILVAFVSAHTHSLPHISKLTVLHAPILQSFVVHPAFRIPPPPSPPQSCCYGARSVS